MPRPPRADVRADRTITLRVTEAEHAALRAWADAQGLALADAIRLLALDATTEDRVSSSETPLLCDVVRTVPARRPISDRLGRAD